MVDVDVAVDVDASEEEGGRPGGGEEEAGGVQEK